VPPGWAHALLDEALALRAAGITAPRVLAWLIGPGRPGPNALAADVDLSVNAGWALDEVVAAARQTGTTARVHLKVDSGLGRGGAAPADWADLVGAARKAEAEGVVRVVGLWSHFAYADAPGHPTIVRQAEVVPGRGGTRRGCGHRPGGPPPGQLGGHPEPRPSTTSTWCVRGWPSTGSHRFPDVAGPSAYGLRPAMTLRRTSCT
jgi:alanine racemase